MCVHTHTRLFLGFSFKLGFFHLTGSLINGLNKIFGLCSLFLWNHVFTLKNILILEQIQAEPIWIRGWWALCCSVGRCQSEVRKKCKWLSGEAEMRKKILESLRVTDVLRAKALEVVPSSWGAEAPWRPSSSSAWHPPRTHPFPAGERPGPAGFQVRTTTAGFTPLPRTTEGVHWGLLDNLLFVPKI